LVHGLSSNSLLWSVVAVALAEAGHPAYAVDLRSHGESSVPPDGYDTATAAADLAAVTTALEIAPAIVVGQSWGGNVAVRLAAEHPAMVAALALIDGGWIDLPLHFASWEECEAALRPRDLGGVRADDIRRHIRADHPDWSARAVEATVANLRVEADGTVSRRLSIEHHLQILRSMYDDPPHRLFPALSMPTLLMPAVPAAAADAGRYRARLAAAAAAMPKATIREYAGADHDLHAQHPRQVAADLIALAKEVP
jgi:pimeloyl-ACP methyl ester carboxylesterase